MDKKKQHIISIIIGVILATLLLYIGVRVVQQRASKASQPENLTATRVDVDTCKISATTRSDEPILLKYGETAATFYFRMEAQNIQPQADSTFVQEADINNLGSGKVMFVVENNEDIQTTCEPFSGDSADITADGHASDAAGSPAGTGSVSDTTSSLDDTSAADDATLSPTPTEPEVIDSSDEESALTPTPTGSLVKVALTRTIADAYFKDNPTADFTGCMTEFKDDYYAIVQVCNEAWRAK